MMNLIRANPIVAGIIGAVLLAALLFGIRTCVAKEERAEIRVEQKLEEKGAVTERSRQQQETINAVQNANDAVNNPSVSDIERMRNRFNRARSENSSR